MQGSAALLLALGTALALGVSGVALAQDQDGDGVTDDVDNCPTTFNPSQTNSDVTADPPGDPFGDACDNCRDVCNLLQTDTNGDGCGNQCDADFNDDGVVGLPDFAMLANHLGTTVPPTRPDLDIGFIGGCDSLNGVVGLDDFAVIAVALGGTNGPGLPPDTDCDLDGMP